MGDKWIKGNYRIDEHQSLFLGNTIIGLYLEIK